MVSPELRSRRGFTLIELLTVIAIIAILMGLLFPAVTAARNQARKVQAKTDIQQILTAINAYYTEYGKYPVASTATADVTVGDTNDNGGTTGIMQALRGLDTALNPRGIVFISPPTAKTAGGVSRFGVDTNGNFFDPWGKQYVIMMDADYDNQIIKYGTQTPIYTDATAIRSGVAILSKGIDGVKATALKDADDVVSWQ